MSKTSDGKKDIHYGLTPTAHNLRRLWHISMIGAFSYYLVPVTVFHLGTLAVHRNVILLGFFFVIAFFEILRLTDRWSIGLFRNYEDNRISAPFWFCTTSALLILLTPQWFAAPIILCTTIGDPVLGELRLRGVKYYSMYGWAVCAIPFLVFGYGLTFAVYLSASAVFAEINKPKLKNQDSLLYKSGILDDNFTMQVVPVGFLLAVWFISSSYGFGWLPPGTEELLKPLY